MNTDSQYQKACAKPHIEAAESMAVISEKVSMMAQRLYKASKLSDDATYAQATTACTRIWDVQFELAKIADEIRNSLVEATIESCKVKQNEEAA